MLFSEIRNDETAVVLLLLLSSYHFFSILIYVSLSLIIFLDIPHGGTYCYHLASLAIELIFPLQFFCPVPEKSDLRGTAGGTKKTFMQRTLSNFLFQSIQINVSKSIAFFFTKISHESHMYEFQEFRIHYILYFLHGIMQQEFYDDAKNQFSFPIMLKVLRVQKTVFAYDDLPKHVKGRSNLG